MKLITRINTEVQYMSTSWSMTKSQSWDLSLYLSQSWWAISWTLSNSWLQSISWTLSNYWLQSISWDWQ